MLLQFTLQNITQVSSLLLNFLCLVQAIETWFDKGVSRVLGSIRLNNLTDRTLFHVGGGLYSFLEKRPTNASTLVALALLICCSWYIQSSNFTRIQVLSAG